VAVELSFELSGPSPHGRAWQRSLSMWADTASVANEPCIVIDRVGDVVAASPGCADLFMIDVAAAAGRALVGAVLDLRDFSARQGTLPDWEVKKIPPLLALSSRALARGLLRVWVGNSAETVDAISVPLIDSGVIVGSLSFFLPVNQ
jgi:hypothetical protein